MSSIYPSKRQLRSTNSSLKQTLEEPGRRFIRFENERNTAKSRVSPQGSALIRGVKNRIEDWYRTSQSSLEHY